MPDLNWPFKSNHPIRMPFTPVQLLIFCLTLCIGWIGFPDNSYADNLQIQSPAIKILTLNMHDGYDEKGQNNLSRTVNLLESENPDLIFLQEMEPQKLKIFRTTGYQVLSGMNHNLFGYRFGNAILTRHRIIYHRHHYLPSTKEQRGLDEAAIDVDGNAFIILNTHLGLGDGEQQRQFAEIKRILTCLHGPIILGGDFNVPPSNSLFTELKKNFTEVGQTLPLSATFPASNPQERLDQVWYSRHWQPMEAQTLDWNGSDHRPVEAELALESSSTTVTKQHIPEAIQARNPLLPEIGGRFSTLALQYTPGKGQNQTSGRIDLALTNHFHISAAGEGDHRVAALNYHFAPIDFRDYMSKWRNIRGKGEWILSLAGDNDDRTWLSWKQYYRWNDRLGTRIALSNRQDKMNGYLEQTALLSNRLGYLIGLDTEQKLSLGLCFTPDQKSAVEIRWYPVAAQQKWQVRWKFQKNE